ncbi:uncharacterized protein PG986_012037 [Apiospora aurea]|uniref:Uncharacterized protein n=1 Tax=Apiospora aurea TaxID=335848 RepID=A0ABR1PZA1_9PEZI
MVNPSEGVGADILSKPAAEVEVDVLDDCDDTVEELVDAEWELVVVTSVLDDLLDELEVVASEEDCDDCPETDDSEVVEVVLLEEDTLVEVLIVELLLVEALDDERVLDVGADVNEDDEVVVDDEESDVVLDERAVALVEFHPLVGTEVRRLEVEVAPTGPALDVWSVAVDAEVDVELDARLDVEVVPTAPASDDWAVDDDVDDNMRVDVDEDARVVVEVASIGPTSVASSSGQEVLPIPWPECPVPPLLLGQMVSILGQMVMRLGVSSVETGQMVTTLGVDSV